MFFGNVTSLSKTVMAYLKSARSRYQILCLAEHKQPRGDIPTIQKTLIGMGLKPWWTQARKTPGGVSGGTSVHLQRCFKGHRLDWPDLPKGQLLHEDPDMWTGVLVQGLSNFIVVSAYFKDSIGMHGENRAMLSKILAWVRASGLPWLIAADWNTTPKLLAESGALNGMNAKIVVPADCAITCSSGIGRLLDFVVASHHMASLIEVSVDLDAETTPHTGLDVKINIGLLEDRIRVLKIPPIPKVVPVAKTLHRQVLEMPEDPKRAEKKRRLPRKGAWEAQLELRATEKADVESVAAGRSPVPNNANHESESEEELTWEKARGKAEAWSTGPNSNDKLAGKNPIVGSTGFGLNAKEAMKLGKTYGSLITTAEFYLASRDPLLKDKPGLAIGRAKGPRFRWRKLKEELGCAGSIDHKSACKETRAWALLAGKVKLWTKLRPQVAEQAKVQSEAIFQLVKVTVHNLAKWADDSKDRVKVARAQQWQSYVANWADLSDRQVEIMCQSATDLHASHAKNAAYKATKEFVLWQLKEAEDNNSKGIFKWVKQAGAAAESENFMHEGKVAQDNEEACETRALTWETLWKEIQGDAQGRESNFATA